MTDFDPENPANRNKSQPYRTISVRKDGVVHESSGAGPIIKPNPYRPPVDLQDAIARGLIPENGISWNKDDPNGVPAMGYRKLTPERKEVFLRALAENGRVLLACMMAGVVPKTIEQHRAADREFDAQCKLAADMYHEMTVGMITAQARAGHKDIKYDKEGNIISERTVYETQIRLALLKRGDSSYNDVSKQQVEVTGGAVVVPAPTDSVESWDSVVARYTGSASVGTSGGNDGPDPGAGAKALAEGRVIKRTVVETDGEQSPADESKT